MKVCSGGLEACDICICLHCVLHWRVVQLQKVWRHVISVCVYTVCYTEGWLRRSGDMWYLYVSTLCATLKGGSEGLETCNICMGLHALCPKGDMWYLYVSKLCITVNIGAGGLANVISMCVYTMLLRDEGWFTFEGLLTCDTLQVGCGWSGDMWHLVGLYILSYSMKVGSAYMKVWAHLIRVLWGWLCPVSIVPM